MPRAKRIVGLTLVVLIACLLLFGDRLVAWYVDWLWFGELGQRGVFLRIVTAQLELAAIFGLSLALLLFVNLVLARRSSPPLTQRLRDHPLRERIERAARIGLRLLIVGGSAVVGVLGAIEASTHWDEYLKFRHPQSFGVQDPIFHRDIGFYVFTLPFWKYLYGWAFVVFALVTVATAAVYYFDRAIDFLRGQPRVAPHVRAHLSILLGIMALIVAWGYRIDAYDLLYGAHTRYFGAGYADIHARLPAINILTVVALIAAGGFFLNAYIRALILPLLALGFMAVASLTVGGVFPAMVQRFQVQPNEANLERPYIGNHMRLTRAAYGLGDVRPTDFAVKGGRPAAGLRQQEAGTLENIRLWDYRALAPTYGQLQGLRDYYDLSRIDIDRYRLNGREQQVMLAARELDTGRIPTPSWVRETLQFTHGYGLVMSTVNEVVDGQPRFLVGSLPLRAENPELLPQRPQVYFGELTEQPVIAPSKTEEFDFSIEQQREGSRFRANAGIPLGSSWLRAIFSLYLRETNLILSDQVTPASRLLIRRKIDERAGRLAPFLALDHDPYLVDTPQGLFWIQDAYTTSDRYPYSQPIEFWGTGLRRMTAAGVRPETTGELNYIRNSVKIAVDAYSGRTEFYVSDPNDPLVRAYAAIFPGLFKPLAQLPPALLEHVRYPEDLFTVQAHILAKYHVEDPIAFYNQTAFWDIPRELIEQREEGEGARRMEAYYVTMRLPGEAREEFALIQPFVFRGAQNMSAWLAARCDPPHLGEMRLFTFSTYVRGPELIDQAIQAEPSIAAQLTLLNREGSRVNWGNLLVLPLGDTLLYVRPLYLAASTVGQRESVRKLERVIVAQGDQVVMAESLEAALDEVFQGGGAAAPQPPRGPSPAPAGQAPASAPEMRRKILAADQSFTAAQQALARNDWATFGQQMQKVQRAFEELRRMSGGGK